MTAKKEKILQAALELFSEKGFSATTTKEIAGRSGVAEGLLFYYFKDKNGLLKELTRQFSFIESIKKEIQPINEKEPNEALIQFGHLYLNFLSQNKSFLSFIWSPEMTQNREVSEEVSSLIETMTHQAARLLNHSIDREIGRTRIETAASMFLSSLMTYGLLGDRMKNSSMAEHDDFIKETVDILLKGLNAR
ncbi:TetR/AcrR family transcriptional regulator [Neobacillus sp. Marseille-QA0830]